MTLYELICIVDDEQQERLSELAKRYEKINGWKEKDILQFGVVALKKNMDLILEFLEITAEQLESERS